jgi:WD40 repeat protein
LAGLSWASRPDGAALKIKLWDARNGSGRDAGHVRLDKLSQLYVVALSPDCGTVAVGNVGKDGEEKPGGVLLWDVKTRGGRVLPFTPNTSFHRVLFSSDGKALAAVGSSAVQVFYLARAKPKRRVVLKRAVDPDDFLALGPGGKALAVSSHEGMIRVWDVATGKQRNGPPEELDTHFLALAPDGLALAILSGDRTVKLRNLKTGGARIAFEAPVGEKICAAVFLPKGKELVTVANGPGSNDGAVRVWELATGDVTATFRQSQVSEVAVAPDGETAASVSGSEGTGKIWDLQTGKERASLQMSGKGPFLLRGLAFAPDGKTLAGGVNGTVRLWDAATGMKRATIPAGVSPVWQLAFAGGRLVVAGGSEVQVWDVRARRKLYSLKGYDSGFGYASGFTGLTASRDGKTIFFACLDGRVVRWEPAARRKKEWRLPGVVLNLALAPDGRHLFLANGNGTVSILRLAGPPVLKRAREKRGKRERR